MSQPSSDNLGEQGLNADAGWDRALAAAFGEGDVGSAEPVLRAMQAGVGMALPILVRTPAGSAAGADAGQQYQLFDEIARGGMGVLIQGRDTRLGRDLVFKVLREEHRDNAALHQRFIEEAQIGGQLQHPGIVPVYELGQFEDRRPYFTMKLVKGRTLAGLLAERDAQLKSAGVSLADDLPRFVQIFVQVCQTVAYAHNKGVLHRDLKPANIMVGDFGEVQVMDWGLAKVLRRPETAETASAPANAPQESASPTPPASEAVRTLRTETPAAQSQVGTVMGTFAYMSPEQARGELDKLDARCDTFALGSILCEILTGQPAYVGANVAEIRGKAERADLADAMQRLDKCGADAELCSIARGCLQVELESKWRWEDHEPGGAGPLSRIVFCDDYGDPIEGEAKLTLPMPDGSRLVLGRFKDGQMLVGDPKAGERRMVAEQVGRTTNAEEVAKMTTDYQSRVQRRLRRSELEDAAAAAVAVERQQYRWIFWMIGIAFVILVGAATYIIFDQGHVVSEYKFVLELEGHLYRGSDRLARGDHEESIKSFTRAAEAYRQAVAKEPDSFLAQSNLALCLLLVNQPHEAAVELDRALALQPDKRSWLVDEILFQGDKLLRAGRTDDARAAAAQALRLDPEHASALRLQKRAIEESHK